MSKDPAALGLAPGECTGVIAAYGFVPNVFLAQKDVPRVISAEDQLVDAILARDSVLTREQKLMLLRGVSHVLASEYCLALHAQSPRACTEQDAVLLRFALKLAGHAPWISAKDVEGLRQAGFDDAAILEAVVTTALGQLLCTLAKALVPPLDAELTSTVPDDFSEIREGFNYAETSGPYLWPQNQLANDFPPFTFFREQYGFVPNLYRGQALRPDLIEAEVRALEGILIPEDLLSRIQKEQVVLAISAANLNTYYVAMRRQILSALGVSLEECDQIVEDHQQSSLSPADKSLLDGTRNLARSSGYRSEAFDSERLRSQGFTHAQIVEGVAMVALTNFLNTLQSGLGTVPDFPPHRVFTPKDLYPELNQARPTTDASRAEDDPDSVLVARVQSGDAEAFEDLVRRHSRRVFGVLSGVVGNIDDARDATQDVFLKAFEHIGTFQGRSKFSTWLTSIAINTGTELLRRRRPTEILDESDVDEGFRPRQIQSWTDNPEQVLAASQLRDLVREGVLRLPQRYRTALILRDLNQLSTEEAAAALGLSIPAMKARILRGRLMLRESLAPHFIREKGSSGA